MEAVCRCVRIFSGIAHHKQQLMVFSLLCFCFSIIGLLIGTLIAFNVIIGDLVPSIFQNLSGIQVNGL